MIQKIRTLSDVETYAKELIDEGTNFHPDDDFCDYVDIETGEPSFTKEGVDLRNDLMKECFKVCSQNQINIYNFMTEIFLKETGMDELIPLPSSIQ